MKIICISDTHGEHESVQLPAGDVLLHAGDITAHGSRSDFQAFLDWLVQQPHQHKVFIAGNHDTYLEQNPKAVEQLLKQHNNVHYLNDSGVELEGVRFWGSPITPRFHDWSFMREKDDIEKHWALIPNDTQVLITHGPVWGVLDEVARSEEITEHTGCKVLKKLLSEKTDGLAPDYHVFGHIHEGYGSIEKRGTQFLNVSTMNEHYVVQNPPVVIDLDATDFPKQP